MNGFPGLGCSGPCRRNRHGSGSAPGIQELTGHGGPASHSALLAGAIPELKRSYKSLPLSNPAPQRPGVNGSLKVCHCPWNQTLPPTLYFPDETRPPGGWDGGSASSATPQALGALDWMAGLPAVGPPSLPHTGPPTLHCRAGVSSSRSSGAISASRLPSNGQM